MDADVPMMVTLKNMVELYQTGPHNNHTTVTISGIMAFYNSEGYVQIANH